MSRFFIFGLIFIMASCSSEEAGLSELSRLCEKDAGLRIYKAVEADGYYDTTRKGGALGLLIPSSFNFTEFCNFEPNISSLFKEAGCWRLTKIPRESERCDGTIDKILWSYNRNGYSEFKEKNCIAVEKIEKPMARYRYELDIKEWWLNERAGTKITSYTGRVVHSGTGDVIGKSVNYILRPQEHNSPPTINCGSYYITGLKKSTPFSGGLIEKTLLSQKIINKQESLNDK